MKLSELPENYRKAQGIEDFFVGDVIYYFTNGEYYKAIVDCVEGVSLTVKHGNTKYLFDYTEFSYYKIHVLDKEKEPKHNFKVNDRVTWAAYDDFIGTIIHITNSHIDVLWCSNDQKLSKGSYGKAWWSELKPIQEPKLTTEITLDLKVHFNLDTTGIETVLVDCVKALVSNGKYQEAKELCELLLSVQSLGKAQNATQDEPKDGSTKGA